MLCGVRRDFSDPVFQDSAKVGATTTCRKRITWMVILRIFQKAIPFSFQPAPIKNPAPKISRENHHFHLPSQSLLTSPKIFHLLLSSSHQMNCLQNLSRSHALPFQGIKCNTKRPSSSSLNLLGLVNCSDQRRSMAMKAMSGSTSSVEKSDSESEGKKSEIYSHNMTEAMGAVLTYRHELGMNYNFISPDLIVGSCLQTPQDVNKLREIGVKTVFCLQQDPDLEYFGVDISAIRDYAKTCGDIEHLRAEIRDFDSFDLRMRLPAVVSKLYKAINENGGVTYVHCTAGLGRAPAVTMAYMFWVQGYKLMDAHRFLLSKRSCFPKLDAIKSATADILTGLKKKLVSFIWEGKNCSSVEMAGLDIGWGQRIPLTFDKEQGLWILRRELPEGHYEYKYIVDGEWLCNQNERVTAPNKDGHVNNYVDVVDNDPSSVSAAIRKRFTGEDFDLNKEERLKIRELLEAYPDY